MVDFDATRKVLEALERGKVRSSDPTPAAAFLTPGSAELLSEIERTWSLARGAGLSFPPGVYRHRTVEDMSRQTEAWNDANAARLRSLLAAARVPAYRKPPPTPDRE